MFYFKAISKIWKVSIFCWDQYVFNSFSSFQNYYINGKKNRDALRSFFTFFKLNIWYQITQSITNVQNVEHGRNTSNLIALLKLMLSNTKKIIKTCGSTRGRSRAVTISKMERFVIIVNGWKPLTIIIKRYILDVAASLDPPPLSQYIVVMPSYKVVESIIKI